MLAIPGKRPRQGELSGVGVSEQEASDPISGLKDRVGELTGEEIVTCISSHHHGEGQYTVTVANDHSRLP